MQCINMQIHCIIMQCINMQTIRLVAAGHFAPQRPVFPLAESLQKIYIHFIN